MDVQRVTEIVRSSRPPVVRLRPLMMIRRRILLEVLIVNLLLLLAFCWQTTPVVSAFQKCLYTARHDHARKCYERSSGGIISHKSHTSETSKNEIDDLLESKLGEYHHLQRAKDLVTKLASDRTWRRLVHVYELATTASDHSSGGSCVDVGCDHGLLAIALASSGQFAKVFGTDVSSRALHDGAVANYERASSLNVADVICTDHNVNTQQTNDHSPVLQSQMEFFVADGITDFERAQAKANTICICGLGVYTILQILCPTTSGNNDARPKSAKEQDRRQYHLLDRLGCTRLVLQPTGTDTRPRNMIKLYDELHKIGWDVSEERIDNSSDRWYITASFIRSQSLGSVENGSAMRMPCESISRYNIATLDDGGGGVSKDLAKMYEVYQNYVSYHKELLQRELQVKTSLYENDKRWLHFCEGVQ